MPGDRRIAIFDTIRAFEDGVTSLSTDAAVTAITSDIGALPEDETRGTTFRPH